LFPKGTQGFWSSKNVRH